MSTDLLPDQAERGSAPAAPAAATRLVSLDAFRGFTMFWIIGGSALVLL